MKYGKKVVLVTAIGTVTSTAIVKQLMKIDDLYIIGADINNQKEIATSLDCDEFYKFPYSTTDEYVEFALKFCKEHQVDYYYAVIDKEVVNISKNRDKFTAIGTKLCVANYEFARICHFKDVLSEWVCSNYSDIAIKEYKRLEDAKNAVYPLFIKPNEGVASNGCKRINSYEELLVNVDEESAGKTILIQDYITGSIITVDCIRNKRTKQKAQIQRRELLRNSNGCGIAVEIIYNEKLSEICDHLMESLDLNGVVNIEFFETENGFKIIEINPRFSAGTQYSCMAGINTVIEAMNIVDEKPCTFGKVEIGTHFAERYEAYRMD